MGRQLFEAIDGILAETGSMSTDVRSFVVETHISDTFTSVKIGEVVARTWNYAMGTASVFAKESPTEAI